MLASAAQRFLTVELRDLFADIRRLQQSQAPLERSESETLIRALVIAEDRRFYAHEGVDTRGLFRALCILVRSGPVQGASTITQQLVRVLTNDYRRSLRRKIKEMCLACAVHHSVPKEAQAVLYLQIGYFGWQMNGLVQARRRLQCTSALSVADAAALVARLRYPEPQHATELQQLRIERRANYIRASMKL
jgi:membrane carboxypeptidase/penicillin-binding protein